MSKKNKTQVPNRSNVGTATAGTGWVRRTLTAEFLSDAHLGSGSGGGGIDALVARDRHDRPVIWASHLEGVLRDAARRLRGDEEASAFFGRAGGQQQRAVFTSLYAQDSPESHIWRSTARVAFDNRAPKDDTLRVIEYVPKGTKLVGEVEQRGDPCVPRMLPRLVHTGFGERPLRLLRQLGEREFRERTTTRELIDQVAKLRAWCFLVELLRAAHEPLQ